jgi:hypothetical protein
MNSAESRGTSRQLGIGDTGPNAMIFPVYGEVTQISECPDPKGSRDWLMRQGGVYREIWDDGLPKMLGGFKGRGGAIQTAGNYLVGVASDVENIPETLQQLRAISPLPENVPKAPDHILEMINRFYKTQGLGIPQFVIAAFALAPGQIEKKNPITLHYTQEAELDDKIIFPALDYHGQGDFEPYVTRDHRLLFATQALNETFRPAMRDSAIDHRPQEFELAPVQFPIEIRDVRKGSDRITANAAPNNDYMFDTCIISESLQVASSRFNTSADALSRREISAIITETLGEHGVIQYSNQPATTVEEYAAQGDQWSSTLDTYNYELGL